MTNTTANPARPLSDLDMGTPWGTADQCDIRAEGIVFYATPSHGGFKLDDQQNAKVHRALRNRNGWYEEDCEWSKVAFTFPTLFTPDEREAADKTLRAYFPDAYEKLTNTKLAPGQSFQRDQAVFNAAHRLDWVVISAIGSNQHKGFVECFATIGGVRETWGGPKVQERRFLVPDAEYAKRCIAFVIDPDRHPTYDGTSSFVGWRG